ncbi:MAG: N-acetylmannosamine-6-phosphate 2-epimerase [Candidatus Melainabacteria bacterium]|nr:N-acetylmannosamine-6-phosphate 2-epimerase [Candidatus Melainabacteria bacterium]
MLNQIRGGLVVSVQADGAEPLNQPDILTALAQSVVSGGAMALRLAQPHNIRAIRAALPSIPLIGLTKPEPLPTQAYGQVYITPGWPEMESLVAAGAEMIAMDATARPRPGGETLAVLVERFRKTYPQHWLMADVDTLENGLSAAALGFDCIGTTLSGYTPETLNRDNGLPDWDLLRRLRERVSVPILLEGRVWEPSQVAYAFEQGAHAVVVGSAITRPQLITRRFAQQALAGGG